MGKKQVLTTFVIVLAAILGTVWVTCHLCRTRSVREQRAIVAGVKVEAVKAADIDEFFETAGTLKARSVSEVASRVMGAVTALKVKQGDKVKAGDVLFELDDKDLVERYKSAQAASEGAARAFEAAKERLSLAETTYARYKTLAQQNAVAQQQMDEVTSQKKVAESELAVAQAAIERAKSSVEEARVTLAYAKVTSPTDGVVTWRNIEVGSMAQPGQKLITVEDTSQFTVDINVDERMSGMVRTGMPVDVSIESLGQKMKSQVAEVVPSVDPTSRAFLVKLVFPHQEGLVTGLHARAYIKTGQRKAITVPTGAIVRRGQLTGVYVVDSDNVVNYRLIRLGKEETGVVEVLSGLSDGERVIVEGVDKAVDGGMLSSNNN